MLCCFLSSPYSCAVVLSCTARRISMGHTPLCSSRCRRLRCTSIQVRNLLSPHLFLFCFLLLFLSSLSLLSSLLSLFFRPQIISIVFSLNSSIRSDPAQTRVRNAIAGYVCADPSEVVCGTGSDELIDLLIRLVLPPAVLTCSPSFAMYRFLALQYRCRLVDVPRTPAPDFALDMPTLKKAVLENPRCIGE